MKKVTAMTKRKGLSFNHMGLYVRDLGVMEDFYTGLLGFSVTDRGTLPGPNGPVSLVFMSRDPLTHHQVVLASGRPEEPAFNPINQLSFAADSLATLREIHQCFQKRGAKTDSITHGNAISFYVHDPEGNRLELFWDTPWYVSQPMKVPVDLDLPDEELMKLVEQHAKSLPGFCSRAEWESKMRKLMGVD